MSSGCHLGGHRRCDGDSEKCKGYAERGGAGHGVRDRKEGWQSQEARVARRPLLGLLHGVRPL